MAHTNYEAKPVPLYSKIVLGKGNAKQTLLTIFHRLKLFITF